MVVLVFSILSFLCGFVLGSLRFRKEDGLFLIENVDGKTLWTLDMKTEPEMIKMKRSVRLKVCLLEEKDSR